MAGGPRSTRRRVRLARADAPARAGRPRSATPSRRWQEDGAAHRPRLRPGAAPRRGPRRGRPPGRGHATRSTEAPPPGAIALIDRSLNGGFTRRAGRPHLRHRPRAVRDRPGAPPEGPPPGRAARHPRAPDARRPRRPHRPRRRPLRADAAARRRAATSATTSSCRSRRAIGSSSRSSRSPGSPATPAAERPQLSKLGGTEWLRAKQRVRTAVADLADELLALYAARAGAQGHAFGEDTPWQGELEASFPYEETIDQLRAAAEVKADMELQRPMDRLVVGDVGYGKTEVALRAAFKATQDGKQVAVLVPTTVLAAQHHTTFGQRFAAFPLRGPAAVAVRVGEGAGDDDRRPRRRDGRPRHRHAPAAVEGRPLQGPRPRRRRRGAALRGRRQGAAQAAPPRGRRPDAVGHADPAHAQPGAWPASATCRSSRRRRRTGCRSRPASPRPRPGSSATRSCASSTAAARSSTSTTGSRRSRPRPSSCAGCCRTPASSSATARWPRARSRRSCSPFADGEADVLVCTTIIESGLDIPNANTIIIDRADTLGLAQLYQLRGRVGPISRVGPTPTCCTGAASG